MSPVIADTHVLLWWLLDSPELGPRTNPLLDARDFVASDVSLWEIAIKSSLGKLKVRVETVRLALDRAAVRRLAIADRHFAQAEALPFPGNHRDPFDRMLIAQAISEGRGLLSADRRFPAYDVTVLDPRE